MSLGHELFPICRSLTGDGNRKTLDIIKKEVPELKVYSVPSGYKAFDWVVPREWNIDSAYIKDSSGNEIINFKCNNLHVVGYSTPVDKKISYEELQSHLFSLPEKPNAIPYMTSYYRDMWGFCISENDRKKLVDDVYEVKIDSKLQNGFLNYAEVIIPGKTEQEVFLSTYICHPSMANNELSGPIVTVELIEWIKSLTDRKYTYRVVFIPETIGSIVYLSKNMTHMKHKVVAGFNITCVGDERCYSYLPSRCGNTISDKAAKAALGEIDSTYKKYTWLDRGSDERQYCAPGVDLPIATIMRSKYAEYPEYHTSLDKLGTVVTEKGLQGAVNALIKAIYFIEENHKPKINVLCEPQLGKRGLYPNSSSLNTKSIVKDMMNVISYCDGDHDLFDIHEKTEVSMSSIIDILSKLSSSDLLYE
ncbi:DUF4910 domain-containing protein [Aliivibrio finisterrensis]|uniref:DUF4910 domain-containing protein n=2 Tax=Aliivibrio finisterrensis TaxID=511998 RepID=A0A6N6RNZ5_9GAMM|nr:DUF4910 domain-containing protein [Aliivibrio finisterrensis]